MRIAVAREIDATESRVAATPETVKKMKAFGADIAVEPDAGTKSGIPDSEFAAAGATVTSDAVKDADVVLKVRRPASSELAHYKKGALVIAMMDPYGEDAALKAMADAGVVAFAMELLPRITRAQVMDVLSSQANLAGYRAVVDAAAAYGRALPMMMTAAGTVPAAKVFVMGAGVAGLQAIATARRLGAVVAGFDVRPAVKEQVESLGATFLELGVTGEETAGGYARELTDEEQRRQQDELAERIPDYDVVITTALIPGRPAPILIPAAAVGRMRPGSVIVDLAAEAGGNAEPTRPGEIVESDGVTLIGLTNLASTMPFHASQLYARNVTALLQHLAPEGELSLDWDDEITSGACVTREKAAAA